jgi:DNA topoisomerase-1
MEYFQKIMDYNFTANVEKEFDEIAGGLKQWSAVIKEFYKPFHQQIEQTTKNAEKFSGERLLGKDPKTGRNVYAKIGRYGPMIQIGDADEAEKPVFAGMQKDQGLETIGLPEALDLFKLPRVVGQYEEKELVAAVGRFGPYIRHDGQFYSIPKTEDPLAISTERAIELIEEKREKDRQKLIKEFAENPAVKILNGRWGAYLWSDGNNYRLPKDAKPEELSLEDCLKIIKEGTSTKKTRTNKKTSSRKKG